MAKKNIGEAVVKLYNNNGGPLDGRTYFELGESETIESLFSNLPSGYKIGEEITILLQNGTVKKYKVTKTERNYISDYKLIVEPKDLKYSDEETSFLDDNGNINPDPTIPTHVKSITQQNIMDWNNKQNALTQEQLTNIGKGGTALQPAQATGLLKNDGTVDTETAGKANSAVQPITTATENNFVAFDSGGNIKDSGSKSSDFIPMPSNGTDGQILEKDSNGVKWSNKPSNGASAYELYIEEYKTAHGGDATGAMIEAEWLASLKAQFGSFVPAEYGTGGEPNDGSADITASADTTNHIYLVNDDPDTPTAKVMWITVVDRTDPQTPTYSWTSIGNVNVNLKFDSGESINNVKIDNTALANPAPNALAKAEDVVRFVENTSEVAKKVDSLEFEAVSVGSVIPQLVDVAEKYVVRSVITNSADGDTVFHISYLPASEQQRLVKIKQVVTGSFSHPVGAVFLLDSPSEIVADTVVDYIVAPATANVDTDVVVTVPANKILCVSRFNYNNRETLNVDIVEWQSNTVNELVNEVGAITEKTDKLEETTKIIDLTGKQSVSNLRIAVGLQYNTLQTSENGHSFVDYFPARQESWMFKIYAKRTTSSMSTKMGQVFFVDNASEIANGYKTTPIVVGITAKDQEINEIVTVPAGKIVAIAATDYSTNILTYNEVIKTFGFLADIEELQENMETKLDVEQISPDYVSAENPLEVIKETPGYTSIFRTMGVIGGSMSTGWNAKEASTLGYAAYKTTVKSGDVYEYIGLTNDIARIVITNSTNQITRILTSSDRTAMTITIASDENDGIMYVNWYQYNSSTDGITKTAGDKTGVKKVSKGIFYNTYYATVGGTYFKVTKTANMPQYSTIQFMARICGAKAYNFSRGGMSARQWPKNDMIDGFNKDNLCQMYLIQLGNNDLTYHNNRIADSSKNWNKLSDDIKNIVINSGHNSTDWDNATSDTRLSWIGYNLGTISDLAGNNGVWENTFFGNMGRILDTIRKVQPAAYVFLSTFLQGYGSSAAGQPGGEFDYNQAIRDIVTYYTENNGANRPEGDELHYYLIDIYTYGKPYSFYSEGIHADTVKGSHLVSTGYLHWAYEYVTYIDWIIKRNMADFNDVAFVGDDAYNSTGTDSEEEGDE